MEIQSQLLRFWPRLQSLFVGVLTVACGIWLANITWFFLNPPQAMEVARIQPEASQSAGTGENWTQVARSIAQREFFGEVVVQQVEQPVEQVEAPETKLNLTLQAVMAQGEGSGFAVIGQRSGNGEVFSVGEDLYGQATLSAVYGDRVIIDRNGSLETLRYEKLNSSLLQSVSTEPTVQEPSTANSFQEALTQANSNVASGGDLASSVRGMVDYVTQRANEDPEAFLQEMGLEAADGGYQVTRRARQLQMVGLRPGDIVTSVNDQPVGNIQSDQMLLNQVLQTGGELKIQIRRGSRSFTIYQSIPTF
jgi:general secretion pathway protein C